MRSTKIISVINQKGGVGKTTTTANLAYSLSKIGRDVLVIDFDQQASLTNYLNYGLDNKYYYSIYEPLVNNLSGLSVSESELAGLTTREMLEKIIVRPTYTGRELVELDGKRRVVTVKKEFGFDLLPSSIDLASFELEVSLSPNNTTKAYQLIKLIDDIVSIKKYDYILIDCNPSLGILTTNAIAASVDGIIIPTNLDLMSTRGVRNLLSQIAGIQLGMYLRSRGNIFHKGVIGIVLNLYSERRMVDKKIANDIDSFYPFYTFKTKIPESSEAKKAVYEGIIYSQKYSKAEKAYNELAEELEKRILSMENEKKVIFDFDRKTNTVEEIDPQEYMKTISGQRER